MKRILFINKTQFGYHTDYYKYCEYLRKDYEVYYLCFDSGYDKLNMDAVKVHYVAANGSKLIRGIRFILKALYLGLKFRGTIFIHYFENCSVLKIFLPWKKMLVDVRTLSVSRDQKDRTIYNRRLEKEIKRFNFITVISDGIQQKLNLDNEKSSILPLGADPISSIAKDFTNLQLLYVGTLNGRNIHQTVEGLNLFLKANPQYNNISYDIIGDGAEYEELKKTVDGYNLNKIVKLHGRIPHFELKPFFDSCNIGVSFIPQTEFYEYQPPTKTYEYILSGMACIATRTYENLKIISKENGILCEDNPDSFAVALEELCSVKNNYCSDIIKHTQVESNWKAIVEKFLFPIIN